MTLYTYIDIFHILKVYLPIEIYIHLSISKYMKILDKIRIYIYEWIDVSIKYTCMFLFSIDWYGIFSTNMYLYIMYKSYVHLYQYKLIYVCIDINHIYMFAYYDIFAYYDHR